MWALSRGRGERGRHMASRARNRKAERGEIVRVIATALSETCGSRAATVYLAEPDGDTFRVHATVGEQPEHDRELFHRRVPRRIWDELFQVKHQLGSSYFVDRRHDLPPPDLGPRREGEWSENDALLVP